VTAAALLAVALSAEPSLLRIGADARAVVRISARAEPRLAASAGRLDAVQRGEDGSWVAFYVPPQEGPPQVAIVTAIADGDVAWLAIPLAAEGDAVVKTRPRASIVVRIGDQIFGPATANARGEAVVPVVVPPGVQTAYHGKQEIPLHVPPARTLHVALGEVVPIADRAQTIPVYVVAVTPEGAPRAGAAIRLRTSRGHLSALRERAPGLHEAQLSIAPGQPGLLRVSAALDDARDRVAEAIVALNGGPAEAISISANQKEIHAEAPQARLHVSARDAAGNPPSDQIRFESTAGDLSVVQPVPGEWDLRLSLPSSFGGRSSVDVRAIGAKTSASSACHWLRGRWRRRPSSSRKPP